jgi:hypothetical protein
MQMTVAVAVMGVALMAMSGAAQESTLKAERTVEYRTGRRLDLKATVGPVRVMTVEFTDLGRATASRLGPLRVGIESEASALLRARIQAENPSTDEWAVTFGVEFLDKNGALIEKITKRSTWEGEAKAYEFEHPVLSYVVPFIDRVRFAMEAKLD